MNKRDLGSEILDGIKDIKDYKKGKAKLKVTELSEPSAPQVIRLKFKMPQSAFAGIPGVSMRTLHDWEQARRLPQGPAVALLRIAEQYPAVFQQLH